MHGLYHEAAAGQLLADTCYSAGNEMQAVRTGQHIELFVACIKFGHGCTYMIMQTQLYGSHHTYKTV